MLHPGYTSRTRTWQSEDKTRNEEKTKEKEVENIRL
jgi:hypothetical protein